LHVEKFTGHVKNTASFLTIFTDKFRNFQKVPKVEEKFGNFNHIARIKHCYIATRTEIQVYYISPDIKVISLVGSTTNHQLEKGYVPRRTALHPFPVLSVPASS
jgi:hypothetical protein